jgi:hypothetical protein
MKRTTVLLLALLLVPAAQANAKFSSASVCGPSSCRDVRLGAGNADNTLLTMTEAALSTPSQLTSKPPETSPWYRVTLGPGDSGHALTLKVLPTSGYQYLPPKEQGPWQGWAKLDEPAARAYRSVTKGLEPLPPSRLVALGAAEPSSVPDKDLGSRLGISAWAWTAVAAATAALGFLSLRWLQRSRRSPSVR